MLIFLATLLGGTLASADSTSDVDSLRYVAIVSRHGSRSSLDTYRTDPYPYKNRTFWPDGPGQITNYGKFQMFELGVALRERYKNYLEASYYPRDVVVEYNPFDRDFTSAMAILAGLYPPVGNQVWNPNLNWQPIPISLRPFDICNLNIPEGGCPFYQEESAKMLKKLDIMNEDYQSLLDYITESTGRNETKLSDIMMIHDTLLMQEENGFQLPEWTKDVFPNKLFPWYAMHMVLEYTGTETLKKLGAGPELKFISEKFKAKANGSMESNEKMYIEVAHDCTLLVLLDVMGYGKFDLDIGTGAYLVFEMRQKSSSLIIETFYYLNPFDKTPRQLNIKGCPNPCTLEGFIKFADHWNPPDWHQICHAKQTRK